MNDQTKEGTYEMISHACTLDKIFRTSFLKFVDKTLTLLLQGILKVIMHRWTAADC